MVLSLFLCLKTVVDNGINMEGFVCGYYFQTLFSDSKIDFIRYFFHFLC